MEYGYREVPMPQVQVFPCPACGVTLSSDGIPGSTLTCQFCGTAVAVPKEQPGGSARPQGAAFPVARSPAAAQGRPAGRVAGLLILGGSGCAGIGCILLGVLVPIAFVVAMLYLPLRMSGSYQQAVDAVGTDPAAIAALGAPVEVSWWLPPMGQIRCSGGGCSASYDIYIRGSRKSGHIYVWSHSDGGSLFSEGAWNLRYDLSVDK
jgi:hypothetical protein